jgi:hypothetical protein
MSLRVRHVCTLSCRHGRAHPAAASSFDFGADPGPAQRLLVASVLSGPGVGVLVSADDGELCSDGAAACVVSGPARSHPLVPRQAALGRRGSADPATAALHFLGALPVRQHARACACETDLGGGPACLLLACSSTQPVVRLMSMSQLGPSRCAGATPHACRRFATARAHPPTAHCRGDVGGAWARPAGQRRRRVRASGPLPAVPLVRPAGAATGGGRPPPRPLSSPSLQPTMQVRVYTSARARL